MNKGDSLVRRFQSMQFKNGLSIIEALTVLSISALLGVIIVPVVLNRLEGGRSEDQQYSGAQESPSEVKAQLKELPSINLLKPEPPVLPSLNSGARIEKKEGGKDVPDSPKSDVPKLIP